MADTAGRDYDYLEEQAKRSSGEWQNAPFPSSKKKKKNSNAVRFNRAAFTRQLEAVKRMLIRLALERLQGNMNRLTLAHMRAIEGTLSQTAVDSLVHLPEHLRVRVAQNRSGDNPLWQFISIKDLISVVNSLQ